MPGRNPVAGFARFSDGTWDTVLGALLTRADAEVLINWEVSMDSAVTRAHQHGTNLSRHTRGPVE